MENICRNDVGLELRVNHHYHTTWARSGAMHWALREIDPVGKRVLLQAGKKGSKKFWTCWNSLRNTHRDSLRKIYGNNVQVR